MSNNNWAENFIKDIPKKSDEYFLMVVRTSRSIAPILYEIKDGMAEHSNDLNDEIFDKYIQYWENNKETGLYIYRYINQSLSEHKIISHYNRELFDEELCYLVLNQEYGLVPVRECDKEQLKKSIKAEKIKDSLVYACYINDTNLILERVEKAGNAGLNKKFQYVGTPLGLCAENDNLVAFKAIVEKGADLNKTSLCDRPLRIAFQYSPDIVRYIYENHREQFEKEVKRDGFSIALYCKDRELLNLIKEMGCDMVCAKKQFPPLHNFADYNNTVGIQFLYDNGVSLDTLNVHGQTALERAERGGKKEAAELLRKLMNL